MRAWGRDLGLGMRFAFAGGREGWVRALLTAVGVGLGVALLLLTTALPSALTARHEREQARMDYSYDYETKPVAKSDATVIVAHTDTTWRGTQVRGRLVEPEGARAPLPPGVRSYPALGEMLVSPKLKEILDSPGGKLLRERLPYKAVGTIGSQGLIGSHELAYYAAVSGLAPKIHGTTVTRLDAFGKQTVFSDDGSVDPVLLLLNLIVIVVLLMPVAVFVAAAVRVGGERRDRRLAALRLIGSDARMTRRVAAGEALAGSLLGLVLGTGFFLAGRQLAGSVELMGISVFPDYLNPSPLLVLLVAVAVPAAAVGVTLLALRGVVIEPLGVVRTARPARRRLWWRALLPLAGLLMLYPMLGQGRTNGEFNEYLTTGGVVLLLVGVTALLPWLVETAVARLGSGGVAWQLAVRRLQLSSGTAARMVNGVAVAVAGAIALQMLFTGLEGDYTKRTGQDTRRAQLSMTSASYGELASLQARFRESPGVRHVVGLAETYLGDRSFRATDDTVGTSVRATLGDCESLREVARITGCRDGDVFVLDTTSPDGEVSKVIAPGRTTYVSSDADLPERTWTVPARLRHAEPLADPTGEERWGVLLTPGALPKSVADSFTGTAFVSLDKSDPDAMELALTTAARIDPLTDPMIWQSTKKAGQYTQIRTGLLVGAACVLGLIGASLLVSQLEQLRERRKLLSSLVAFGTRRRTLPLSVLWQTAIPVTLGLLLAAGIGIALGALLLGMAGAAVSVDWAGVGLMTGFGAGVVVLVTVLSLPPLLRLIRPDGLRTE